MEMPKKEIEFDIARLAHIVRQAFSIGIRKFPIACGRMTFPDRFQILMYPCP